MEYIFFLFFFSSRRRHTRCGRDWSSDVCSSDLGVPQGEHGAPNSVGSWRSPFPWKQFPKYPMGEDYGRGQPRETSSVGKENRSEERRVGKEWRSRWSP